MSLHIAVFAPATRVMSRKLGPTWRQRLAVARTARAAACEASTFASTCGRWLNDGHEPVVRRGVDRHRAARRRRTTNRCRRSYRRPPDCSVRRQVPDGVLEQVGARVLHAGGLGAGDRMAADEARVRRAARRSVAASSSRRRVTSVSSPDASSAARTSSGSAPTGAQAKHSSRALDARPRSMSPRGRSRPAPSARSSARGSRPKPDHLGARDVLAARQGRSSRRSARRRGRRSSASTSRDVAETRSLPATSATRST